MNADQQTSASICVHLRFDPKTHQREAHLMRIAMKGTLLSLRREAWRRRQNQDTPESQQAYAL